MTVREAWLPTASAAVTVKLCGPGLDVSSGDPSVTDPTQEAMPEPPSAQPKLADSWLPISTSTPSSGAAIITRGASRSTRNPFIGPAVTQLPARSQTCTAWVLASAVSLPSAT